MFTTTDADGKKVKIASTVDGETGEHTIAVGGGGSGGGSSQVEVTNFPETQPVSGPLTDAELRAAPVPVAVDFPETQPVSGPLTAAEFAAADPATDAAVNGLSTHLVAIAGALDAIHDKVATEAKQDAIIAALGNIVTELQTANGHLATIATNTAPGGGA